MDRRYSLYHHHKENPQLNFFLLKPPLPDPDALPELPEPEPDPALPKCPPAALHVVAAALGVLVTVRVHSSESVLVMTVRDHTAVVKVLVGVGPVTVLCWTPGLTVTGGIVERTMLGVKNVKIWVEVGRSCVTVVLIAVLAVEVTVGTFTLRLAILGEDRLARCLRSRASATSGSTARISPRFQCRPGGSGIAVGLKVARGSGEGPLAGTVQDGNIVAVMMFWVCSHLVEDIKMVFVVVVLTGGG